MSRVVALYHIVFCTKERHDTIPNEYSRDLYAFMWHLLKEMKCYTYFINGMPNHIHLLIDLSATRALSDVVRDLKAKSSGFMQQDPRFRSFRGWAHEYFASSVSYSHRDAVFGYIKGQREHHAATNFDTEIEMLVRKSGFQKMFEKEMR